MARADRRQFGRRQDNAHGWIVVEGRPRVPCVVRDISDAGARIEVERPSWLPFHFKLVVESLRLVAECEVRHQQQTSVGVLFVQHQTIRPSAGFATVDDKMRWFGQK